MNLLAPENLAFAAALLPPVVLLYFLKIRRAPVVIPSIMLWRKSLHDLKANAPFQRLRRNLLMFLQLAALALLVMALARPIASGSALKGSRLILLIDRSASMASRDEGGSTRFEKAIATAIAMTDDPERAEAMVVSFGSRASVDLPFTSSPVEVRRALAAMTCGGTGTRIDEAMKIAAAAAAGKSDCTVVIMSDGAFGAVPDTGERNFGIELVRFGRRSKNVGITGISVRRPAEDPGGGVRLFVEVANRSADRVETTLDVSHERAPVDAARLDMPPGTTQSRTFNLKSVQDGMLTAAIRTSDDLGIDNEASVLVLPARAPRILLYTGGNVFLENALATIPGAEVTVAPAGGPRPEGDFDIAVCDKSAPPGDSPEKGFLCFGCAPPGFGCTVTGEAGAPLFGNGDWNENHPVNRYVDFSGLFVRKSLKVALPPGCVTLLESRDGPLAAAFENNQSRAVAVFFNIEETDWPFLVSFPVFLNNAVFWAMGGGAGGGRDGAWYKTGEPVEIQGGEGITVIGPSGKPARVSAGSGDRAPVITGTDGAGVYVARAGDGREWRIPVNLADHDETDTSPVDRIEIRGAVVKPISSGKAVNREYWPWVVIAAMALLLVEWWVYNRRLM